MKDIKIFNKISNEVDRKCGYQSGLPWQVNDEILCFVKEAIYEEIYFWHTLKES